MTAPGNELAIVTPTFVPDLERCELLVESVRRCSPASDHYFVVGRRERAAFSHLEDVCLIRPFDRDSTQEAGRTSRIESVGRSDWRRRCHSSWSWDLHSTGGIDAFFDAVEPHHCAVMVHSQDGVVPARYRHHVERIWAESDAGSPQRPNGADAS